jgi:hypothetical protein
MANDPDPETAAKAARLREQIDKLKTTDRAGAGQASEKREDESPREFIDRRMHELDRKNGGQSS